MDIVALSMALSSQKLSTAVSMSVTKLNMDNMMQTNQNLMDHLREMELSVNPNIGGTIDLKL